MMRWSALLFLSAGVLAGPVFAADKPMETALAEAVLDYGRRLEAATAELSEVRRRIADERVPLLEAIRTIEDRLIRLQAEVDSLRTEAARAEQTRLATEDSWGSAVKNLDYLSRVSEENLEGMKSALLPGESEIYGEQIDALIRGLAQSGQIARAGAALGAADLQLERLKRQIGGYRSEGAALSRSDSRIREGILAFVGPEAFFFARDPETFGAVRPREGSTLPTIFELPDWSRSGAAAFFAGDPGGLMIDASGGKALAFEESRDTLLVHLRKGGMVGFVIIGLGAFAFVAGLVKVADLRRLSVDEPAVIRRALDHLAAGDRSGLDGLLMTLRGTTRELMAAGLRHIEKPKALLEEHLMAFILRQRIDHERRLPLLAVIAAAAPLLGLLGTVVGMVKTFTLITVYGTGNAAKLSSGISEALVTTELGLIVAIPTLILHGYLTQRTQRNLSRLEQYAVEFVTASEEFKTPTEESR